MLYIITISSNYIRDAQYADTFGLSDTETQEDSKENAIKKACRIKKHDSRILAAYSTEEVKL